VDELHAIERRLSSLLGAEPLGPDLGSVPGVSDLACSVLGHGAPFVWCHGLTSSRANEDRRGLFDWAPLTSAGRQVIRYDARGHGVTGGPLDDRGAYEWPRLADDLLGLMDHLEIERAPAGGASMGCATLLHAAVQEPGRFERLVLVIPPTAWETRAAQADVYEASAAFVERAGKSAWLELANATPKPTIFEEDPFPFEADIPEELLPTVLRAAAASDLPSPESITTLTQPALVLAWATDPGHPVSTALRLAELLPTAELHVAEHVAEVRAWPERVSMFLA